MNRERNCCRRCWSYWVETLRTGECVTGGTKVRAKTAGRKCYRPAVRPTRKGAKK